MTAIFAGAMFGVQAIAESSASRIVDCLFAGTIIALFAGLVAHFSRRQSSSLRFAVWFAALIALAASPLLSGMVWPRGANASVGLARAAVTVPGSWAFYVFGVWTGIATWFLVRLGIGLWRLHALRETFVPVDLEELDAHVRETLKRCGRRGPVSLCTSERAQVPAAIGLFEPVVVVPRWVFDELSAAELNQVLLHELAHLRRRDGWTNLAQQVIKAVFFFHPAVWWIERKISLEREMACDAAVLAETASPRAYAECLKHLAEETLLRRSLALAQAVLGKVRQTSMRVAQILDGTRHLRSGNHRWRTACSLVTLVIVCGLIEFNEPHLIAFQDGKPTATSVAAEQYVTPAITPASFRTRAFKTTEAIASTAISAQSPINMLASRSNHGNAIAKHARFQLASARAKFPNLLRLASMQSMNSGRTGMVASEAVFVVFETRGYSPSGEPVYEIEVLHVTVLRPLAASGNNEIPHKEI
jgi:beta-lactamase regulating signal transducer with metallopeptidase domain